MKQSTVSPIIEIKRNVSSGSKSVFCSRSWRGARGGRLYASPGIPKRQKNSLSTVLPSVYFKRRMTLQRRVAVISL